MPSYHISTSGQVVKCASDHCCLHSGIDFYAKNLKEAQNFAEQILEKQNDNKSLYKNSISFNDLSENVQNYAQNYYNQLIDMANRKREISEAAKKFRPDSDKIIKLNNDYYNFSETVREIQDNLLLEMCDAATRSKLDPYYHHEDLQKVDSKNKMPESFKQAVANLSIEAQNGRIVPYDDSQLAKNNVFNKFADEVRKIIG